MTFDTKMINIRPVESLVSTIIPVYGVEHYLTDCLESICTQVYPYLQIICTDDGSCDASSEMLEQQTLIDARTLTIHQSNGGLSAARNSGLDIAIGEWLSFVDSDDVTSPHFISLMLNACQREQTPMACCDVIQFKRDESCDFTDKITGNVHVHTANDIFHHRGSKKRYHEYGLICNKLMLRSLMNDVRFPVGKLHEDEFVYHRLVHDSGRIAYLFAALYGYRKGRSGSILNQVSLRRLDVLEAYLQRLQFMEQYYPELVLEQKLATCVVGLNLLTSFYRSLKKDEFHLATMNVKESRKKINFSQKEWFVLNLKQKIYVLMSLPFVIGIMARFRSVLGRCK